MHQSPQKFPVGWREKYPDADLVDGDADRRVYRGSQPKARKFPLREDAPRESRQGRQHPRG